ncbi:hypothetical protein B0J14DRAFT_609640 [Halenospora varia]|nr:hypothetical protein B0J14DRAFT_609640 [Halenospora varia]
MQNETTRKSQPRADPHNGQVAGAQPSSSPQTIMSKDNTPQVQSNKKKGKEAASTFEFINLFTPDDAGRDENRSLVRRHVWKKIKKDKRGVSQAGTRTLMPKSRKCPGCGIESQIQGRVCASCIQLRLKGNVEREKEAVLMHKPGPPSPLTIISNDDDSLGVYPIRMTPEYHSVIRYLHSGSFDEVASFRNVWFTMTLGDEGSFYQILSTMRRHLAVIRGEPDQHSSDWLHNKAIQSVRQRIVDPLEAVTDGMVASVICFLTYSHITGDVEAFKVHKAGLAQMIALRGGIETLDRNFNIRLMILWDDVCGGCAFDILPIHPVPTKVLLNFQQVWYTELPHRLSRTLEQWKSIFPHEASSLDFLEEVHALNARIQQQLPIVWRDDLFLGVYVNPILHTLLMLQNLRCQSIRSASIAEMCRLAALLFLADIRFRFLPFHTTGPHFGERLLMLLQEETTWESLEDLHLWVLITLLVNSTVRRDHREELLGRVVTIMSSLDLTSWAAVVEVLHGFLWLNDVVWIKAERLGREIDGRLKAKLSAAHVSQELM